MKARMKPFLYILVSVLALGSSAAPVAAQSIRLQATATIAAGPVHLQDIAVIEGIDAKVADHLGQTVIVDSLKGRTTIKPEQVLFAMMATPADREEALHLQFQGAAECVVGCYCRGWRAGGGGDGVLPRQVPPRGPIMF